MDARDIVPLLARDTERSVGAAEAMKYDGVRPETIVALVEG